MKGFYSASSVFWGLVGIHVLRKHKIQNDGNYEYNSHTVLSKYRLHDLREKLLI